MSRPKLLCRITTKQASAMAAIAVVGLGTILSVFFLASDAASNSYAIDDPNAVMVDDQHYVSLSVSNADLSFAPTAGSLVDSKQVGVTVSTNVPGGAKLYLSTADSTNALYKDGDTSGSSPAIQPTNRVTTLANMPVNTWGYSLDNTNFQAVPTSNSAALIADVNGSTVGTTSGDVISATVPVYYGAKVDSSLPAGTYSNRVVYSVIGTIPVSISSVAISVGGESVENLQAGEANTIVVTTDLMTSELGTPRVYLTTTNPAGTVECGNVNVAKNSQGYMTITCAVTPTAEATGVTLHITQGSSGDWKWGDFTHALPDIVTPVRPMSDISTMQEMTSGFCASVTMESPDNTARLRDTRDGKYYWVAKLADGNCWMTQNLDLDLSTSHTLTPADTNISSNWTPRTSTTTSTSGYNSNSGDTGKSHNPGDIYYENTSGTDQHYHVGNYYQWSAATAGYTGTSQSTQSICPRGWTLPSRSQFQTLINNGLTSSNFMNAPYYLLRGGYIFGNSLTNAGTIGIYSSSTPNGSVYEYGLGLNSANINISNGRGCWVVVGGFGGNAHSGQPAPGTTPSQPRNAPSSRRNGSCR